MRTQDNEVKELRKELDSTSKRVGALHDRTQRLLDDMHELKEAVKSLYEFVEKQQNDLTNLKLNE